MSPPLQLRRREGQKVYPFLTENLRFRGGGPVRGTRHARSYTDEPDAPSGPGRETRHTQIFPAALLGLLIALIGLNGAVIQKNDLKFTFPHRRLRPRESSAAVPRTGPRAACLRGRRVLRAPRRKHPAGHRRRSSRRFRQPLYRIAECSIIRDVPQGQKHRIF